MNPARPVPGAFIVRVADVPEPGAMAVDFRSGDALFSLLVARIGGDVRAYENVCPHARSPLERPDGRVAIHEKQFMICSAHGASFRIADGKCVGGPGLGTALTVFPIAIVDGEVRAT